MSSKHLEQRQRLRLDTPLSLSSGAVLPSLEIAWRQWGELSPRRDNAVLVCPALTGDSDLSTWWPELLGPGQALDPERDFILCADVLGGSGGSSGPQHLAPDGRPWGARFPDIAVRDMVKVQRLLLEQLGIDQLRLVIGGSLGGMQALEWVASHSTQIGAAVVIAAGARQSAWARGFNHLQRRALDQHNDIELARMVAMLSYRHWDNLDDRFAVGSHDSTEQIEHWLDHHGRALACRFDPVSYRRLMTAMDQHDVGAGRDGWQNALANCNLPVQIIGIDSDLLYPPVQQRAVAEALPNAQLALLEAPQGHDAFLIEQARVNQMVRDFRHSLTQSPNSLRAVGS